MNNEIGPGEDSRRIRPIHDYARSYAARLNCFELAVAISPPDVTMGVTLTYTSRN